MAELSNSGTATAQELSILNPSTAEEEEDWFGDGSSFDSGEDLAAALFAMAGAPIPELESTSAVEPGSGTPTILSVNPSSFRVIDQVPTAARTDSGWTVREQIPTQTLEGKRWGIRQSVQILKRTEQMMARLQHDAVEVTFAAASAAITHGRRGR